GNAKKVDNLIRIALSHCAASEEAVNYVAANIDRILVSGTGTLRTLEEVREISLAIVQRGAVVAVGRGEQAGRRQALRWRQRGHGGADVLLVQKAAAGAQRLAQVFGGVAHAAAMLRVT
ncbi:MAG: hypothetical protein IIZ92_30690, partial [Aquincola sp.]|nr:hypothetical protein [Aquincola sp.]